MHTPVSHAAEGLRARKRRATENAIELAAVSLALGSGFERVTVDQICERADVSRSTFFNYFPSRDAAIVGRPIEVLAGAEADAVLSQHPDDLARGVFLLLFASIGHMHVNGEVMRLRQQLTAEQPGAHRIGTITLVEAGESLAATATAWLADHPEHAHLAGSPAREAGLAVNIVYAAVTAMADSWRKDDADAEAGIVEFDRARSDLRALLTR